MRIICKSHTVHVENSSNLFFNISSHPFQSPHQILSNPLINL
ncbi:hypothetical protein QW060_02615 [Myroides ceti]|uniref:Uncharacterized protein n=1 Tax=Paenimyroides ceti TaxID=395087 RepID=A0ABT8CP95_9FLAO|nr:hypothetical protein [Paenimyroides ceti]MDN3706020.1 hypothetical protein [Paenimyroides ceti]